jgi:hypothetical protein
MTTPDLEITDEERLLLCRLMGDVVADKAFFSLGEMTTITGWSEVEARRLAAALVTGEVRLSSREQRYLGHSLYAWLVSAKKGRVDASPDEVSLAERFDHRRRVWKRSHEGE